MYVISDEAIQDEIQGNGWKRDWVYSICCELLCNNPEQLTPPPASAFSEEWMKYQDNLKEHLRKDLKLIAVADVESRWKLLPNKSEWCGERSFRSSSENFENFFWKMLRPTENVLELYVSIFSCHISKGTGVFDYEYFRFTHDEIDQLFGWKRFMQ